MKVEFYKTSDNPRTVNKTLQLTRTVDIIFRQAVNEQAPLIIMNNANVAGENYVRIPNFNRYYFISSVDNFTAGLVRLHLTTDLLMTYKDIILNSPVQITATEKPSYLSTNLPTLNKNTVRKSASTVTLPSKSSIILTTVGGVNKGGN